MSWWVGGQGKPPALLRELPLTLSGGTAACPMLTDMSLVKHWGISASPLVTDVWM